ncbi:hypothetical protein CB0940_03912 [Cercospora beticola]|uniref:C2H2-type domain-containing protein n=1 Tax=Cercospora beticola TaxID=122368 RepID=A0A2G5HKK7_CERBT|nr:hypothetical protein CB0940_03912 [Cercospora beticola]PIA92742.1 hypothetical protein CB0940_03912 [Cercospora beticola]WPB01114.1 hypothetical protein RHO25_005735 [Cercospora beticola]
MVTSSFRSTTFLLILVLLLATLVRASSSGSEHFDPNDLNWTSAGEELSTMLAYSQYNSGMAASPMASGLYRSGPQPIPRPRPIPNQRNVTDYLPQYLMETSGLRPQQDLMQMQRLSTSAPSIVQPEHGFMPGNMNHPTMIPFAGHPNPSMNGQHFGQAMQAPTLFTANFPAPYSDLRGMNATPQQFNTNQHYNADLTQLFPELPELTEPARTAPQQPQVSQYETTPPFPVTSGSQVLSNENLDNHNLRVDSLPLEHMHGWLGRATAAGVRNMPRLDTNRLVPPPVSDAHLSPTSASSPGSSASRSPRRTKEEMLVGEISCSHCDAAFSTQGDLTHHLRSHQPYANRSHVCPTCNKRFQYRKDLARHAPRHDPNRQRFYCKHAGCKYHSKGFGRQDHLDRHLATQHRMES